MLREDYATWQCGTHQLSLARPRIIGILDVSDGSYPDGEGGLDADAAAERGIEMLDEGADMIDITALSAAGSKAVSPDDEAARIIPVLRRLVRAGAIVSVTTRDADVAKAVLRLGASVINDVSGFTNPAMVEAVADSECGCVVMCDNEFRSNESRKSVVLETPLPSRFKRPTPPPRTTPASARRFTLPDEGPIMREIMGFLGDQARTLQRAGIAPKRICLDPGPGFNKTSDEDIVIQRQTKRLVSMGFPIMSAVSRKSFVGAVTGTEDPATRDRATAGLTIAAIEAGVRLLRVHDVAGVSQTVNAYWSVARKDPRQGFVSLGSNVGDRLGYLSQAVRLIDKIPLTRVVAVSHAYETEPAYGIATPVANAVAEIVTELHPLVLMQELLEVESELHRTRDPKQEGHGPRTIDCDLCWIEGEEHHGRRLELPHPHLGEREYVLVPMEDLMHDPVRFLTHGGVDVKPPSEWVGHVMDELGELDWS